MLVPRAENGCRKLGDLPSASNESKIELWTRADAEGASLLELIEYSWGSGIGWYVQKRLTLDAAQVDALRALLGSGSASTLAPPPRRPLPPVVREANVIQLVFSR